MHEVVFEARWDPEDLMVQQRLVELLHYPKKRLAYRNRTEIAVEWVKQIEVEGQFPHAPYAFDNGVLCRPLTEAIVHCA